jgi:hypothetical protein
MDDLWTQRSNTTSIMRLTDFAGPEPQDLVDMARRENGVRSRLRANSPIRRGMNEVRPVRRTIMSK